MTLFSFRTLALAWTGLAGAAAISAAALQASYVPPVPAAPVAAVVAAPVAILAALPVARPAALPFENRSLLAMLPPPDIRPRLQPHLAEALPVPPVPPLRTVRLEPRRAPVRTYVAEPSYAAYPAWAWRGRLPYPGQYAMGRAYYGGQPGYYGWQPVY